MQQVVMNLEQYIDTYDEQEGYQEYSDRVYIEDIIYGLGASLSEDNKFTKGFLKFKKELLVHLLEDQNVQNFLADLMAEAGKNE